MSAFARLILSALLSAFSTTGAATEFPPGCESFTWNVSRELTIAQTPATSITAGADAGDPARIELDTHYRVRLHRQAEVTFTATPGRTVQDGEAFAGLLTFQVPGDGHYRVAITSRHWIDIVDGGKSVPTVDFQGHRACPLAHKIVQFDLRAGRDLVLQFAAGSEDEIGVVITAAPVP